MRRFDIEGCINCRYCISERDFYEFCTYGGKRESINVTEFGRDYINGIELIFKTCKHYEIGRLE